MKIIALLSDFGTKDGYVASMKGVILSIAPEVILVDITHDIDPFRIESGAYVLKSVKDCFPPSTIFIAVVDPGVGTDRKALIVKTKKKNLYFLGPDNGILSWIFKEDDFQAWVIQTKNSPYLLSAISDTFHGRDIFAPLGAYLAKNIPPESLISQETTSPYIAPWVRPVEYGNSIQGTVIHIDRFGNVVTNIQKKDVEEWLDTKNSENAVVYFNNKSVSFCRTYGDVPQGELAALWGSSGHLEISANREKASHFLTYSDSVTYETLYTNEH